MREVKEVHPHSRRLFQTLLKTSDFILIVMGRFGRIFVSDII